MIRVRTTSSGVVMTAAMAPEARASAFNVILAANPQNQTTVFFIHIDHSSRLTSQQGTRLRARVFRPYHFLKGPGASSLVTLILDQPLDQQTGFCVCVWVGGWVPRNQFNHAQPARFNIPTFLPLLQTMSSVSGPADGQP